MRRQRRRPVWAALSFAPFAVAPPVAVAFVLVHVLMGIRSSIDVFLPALAALLAMGLLSAWTFDLIWRVLALRRNKRGALTYIWPDAGFGAVLGAAFGYTGIKLSDAMASYPGLVLYAGIAWFGFWGALMGGGTAWVAWLLRRPDRDTARLDVAGGFN